MNDFVIAKSGGIEIRHFSTASLVKILNYTKEEVSQGVVENVTNEYWFEYSEIADLYKALRKLEEHYNWMID
jgi:hypothetical protein